MNTRLEVSCQGMINVTGCSDIWVLWKGNQHKSILVSALRIIKKPAPKWNRRTDFTKGGTSGGSIETAGSSAFWEWEWEPLVLFTSPWSLGRTSVHQCAEKPECMGSVPLRSRLCCIWCKTIFQLIASLNASLIW